MRENRTTFPSRKVQMYAQLSSLPSKYKVVALIRMEKVRGSQILQLRKKLRDEVEFVSIKDKVAIKALRDVQVSGISELIQDITGQCMLLFTNIPPFRLSTILDKNRIMMAARGGDIASIDVEVAARNTGIAPGPMLTEFKDAGIPTKIDQGTIWIAKDTVPVKKGEVISEQLASMLGKLDIKPIEAGIVMTAAVEDGIRFTGEEMSVDVEAVLSDIAVSHQDAINLSVESGYATAESIVPLLSKASLSARTLSVESGHATAETGSDVLNRAHNMAVAVSQKASKYTPK